MIFTRDEMTDIYFFRTKNSLDKDKPEKHSFINDVCFMMCYECNEYSKQLIRVRY